MQPDKLFLRYRDLQQYVGWAEEDAQRVCSVAPLLRPHFHALVEDFYNEIERHPQARKVITGGAEQIVRLKVTLHKWLEELLSGTYDRQYVVRRWKVGLRHVEIGLDQVYTNAALSRLRSGMLVALEQDWPGDARDSLAVRRSLNKLLDLDLAIIEDAYQTEFQQRQQRSERLAAIGQVAGGVAHELRNPLNVVRTSIYFLLNAKNLSPEKIETHLTRIDRQVGMADDVITALNNFARLPLPQQSPVDIERQLRDVLETNPPSEQIRLDLDLPADLPQILGDAHQLAIVFANLIRNACESMPDGGTLRVTARRSENHVRIDIADSGVGIRGEDLSQIMEPLYSTKSRGIGLGLAITRAILDKHDGRLTVQSEPDCGTTFTVSLPIVEHMKQED